MMYQLYIPEKKYFETVSIRKDSERRSRLPQEIFPRAVRIGYNKEYEFLIEVQHD